MSRWLGKIFFHDHEAYRSGPVPLGPYKQKFWFSRNWRHSSQPVTLMSRGWGNLFFFFIPRSSQVRTCAFRKIRTKILIFPKLTPQIRSCYFDVEVVGEMIFFSITVKLTSPYLCLYDHKNKNFEFSGNEATGLDLWLRCWGGWGNLYFFFSWPWTSQVRTYAFRTIKQKFYFS